jgi:uncharacterized membrane protein YeaQ/YmgE (transglycosylase-associated protein family)
MIGQFLHAIGWRFLSSGELFFIALMGGGVIMISAWLADLLMQEFSFGVIGNMILLICGAILGLAIMVWIGMPPTRRDFLPALIASGVSATLMLVVFAAMKRAV